MEQITKTLLAGAARTADGTGDAFAGLGNWDRATLVLEVTAAATDASDTLNVYVQCSFDGSVWFDVAAFPQVVGNGGVRRWLMRLSSSGNIVPDFFEMVDGALAAGTVKPCYAPGRLRCKWDVTESGAANLSFTFSVTARLEYDS